MASLPDPAWLIAHILPADCFVGVFGPEGSAKSFLALEVALRVASGESWLGHEIHRKGEVVFVAGEGRSGHKNRIDAWKDAVAFEGRAGVHFTNAPVMLNEARDVESFIADLKAAGIKPVLIIFDTLQRCFTGDENSTRDMSALVAGADRIRAETGATILVIHHSPKDRSTYRGSSVFAASADMLAHVSKKGDTVTVTCTKMKEGEPFSLPELRLTKHRRSAILVPSTPANAAPTAEHRHNRLLLDVLGEDRLRHSEWRDRAVAKGFPGGSFDRHLRELKKCGSVQQTEGRYRASAGGNAEVHIRSVDACDEATLAAFEAFETMGEGERQALGVKLGD
jgi:hypothetical protein